MYVLIVDRDFKQIIGRIILNGALSFSWNYLQVPMVDMGFCDGTVTDNYKYHISIG